jgi:hypothetical protein
MKKRTIDRVAIKRAASRSTRDSASLERRVVPAGYVRSEKTERYLAERRQRA